MRVGCMGESMRVRYRHGDKLMQCSLLWTGYCIPYCMLLVLVTIATTTVLDHYQTHVYQIASYEPSSLLQIQLLTLVLPPTAGVFQHKHRSFRLSYSKQTSTQWAKDTSEATTKRVISARDDSGTWHTRAGGVLPYLVQTASQCLATGSHQAV